VHDSYFFNIRPGIISKIRQQHADVAVEFSD
jgi:hypothetical protein